MLRCYTVDIMQATLETVHSWYIVFAGNAEPLNEHVNAVTATIMMITMFGHAGFTVDPFPKTNRFSLRVTHRDAAAMTLFLLSHTLPKGYSVE